jgi:hypothetical protein
MRGVGQIRSPGSPLDFLLVAGLASLIAVY